MPSLYRLEDGLNDCAVIRTTFETLVLFPANDPIRAEMQELIDAARNGLIDRLNKLCLKFETGMASLPVSVEAVRDSGLPLGFWLCCSANWPDTPAKHRIMRAGERSMKTCFNPISG